MMMFQLLYIMSIIIKSNFSLIKLSFPKSRSIHCTTALKGTLREVIISDKNSLEKLNGRNFTQLESVHYLKTNQRLWSAYRSKYQLDCIELEDYFISGKAELTPEERSEKWNTLINSRLDSLQNLPYTNDERKKFDYLKLELKEALNAVKAASFVSRSIQSLTKLSRESINKNDNSPVTVADFTVQAIIIDRLSYYFPNDYFIAEEDSSVLQLESNQEIMNQILDAVSAATGEIWSKDRLFSTIDKGQYQGSTCATSTSSTNTMSPSSSNRIWVLDPVDGTKGFVRGEHYCIALALLIDGVPKLSVLGCPNLSLDKVVKATPSNILQVATLDDYIQVPSNILDNGINGDIEAQNINDKNIGNTVKCSDNIPFHLPSSGSIYYAITGEGAYAKRLSMNMNAGYEVSVNMFSQSDDIVLCESTEASHGNREISTQVYNQLDLKSDYLRLDGQCKYCVVGAGAAVGNLRLPPTGYREKIWDHAAGAHFVTEAGGKVTDLNGDNLDFTQGRYLSADVTSIIATNGRIHKKLVDMISIIKKDLNESKTRIFGQDK